MEFQTHVFGMHAIAPFYYATRPVAGHAWCCSGLVSRIRPRCAQAMGCAAAAFVSSSQAAADKPLSRHKPSGSDGQAALAGLAVYIRLAGTTGVGATVVSALALTDR